MTIKMSEEKKYTYAFKEKGTSMPYKIPSNGYGVPAFKTEEDAKSDASMHLAGSNKGLEVIVLDIENLVNDGVIKGF
jgi:hypothetical protein